MNDWKSGLLDLEEFILKQKKDGSTDYDKGWNACLEYVSAVVGNTIMNVDDPEHNFYP